MTLGRLVILNNADAQSPTRTLQNFALLAAHVAAGNQAAGIRWGGELKTQMGEPYKRIIVMHLTIILGGFLTMLLRAPAAALLVLIVLKTAADLRAHRKEHTR